MTDSSIFNRRIVVWMLRGFLTAGGGVLCLWPIIDARFWNSDGYVQSWIGVPLVSALACFLLAWTVGRQWFPASFWISLALVSQAMTLQLVNAGPALRYQHYQPLSEMLTGTPPILWIFIVFQTLFVIWGLRIHGHSIWAGLRTHFRWWQLLLLAALFVLSSTTVAEDVGFYISDLLLTVFIQTVSLCNIVLAALAIPQDRLKGWRGICQRFTLGSEGEELIEPNRLDRFALLLALWVVVLAAVLNVYSYEQHPHVPDEVAYITHARFFAQGALTLPAPPVPEGFDVYLMKVNGDRWYPVPPPGWPLILALGAFFGVPWLVNPILGGVNLLLVYILLRELYPKSTARLTILLLAISPWYIFLAMSFMTHIFTLTCALLAALGVALSRRTGRVAWAWGGGFALGMIALIRPLEAVAMAGLLGLWSIGIGGKRLKLMGIAGLVLGSMMVGAVALLYNAALTGNVRTFPIMAYTDEFFGPKANAYGFGPDRGMGWGIDPYPGHSPRDAIINTNLNVSVMNSDLFGWSLGSLLLIGVLFVWWRLRRSDYLMLAVIVVIYGLHFFYYFSGGPDFAARYWFLMIVPLVVLSARAVQLLAGRLSAQFADADVRVFLVVGVLCMMTILNFIPWRAIDKYHHFRGMRPDIRYLAQEYNFGTSLVLIRGTQHPEYDSAMIYNPLNFDAGEPIYAWDRDLETRLRLLKTYQDRPVWIVEGPSLTQRGFVVVEGPLSAEDVLASSQ